MNTNASGDTPHNSGGNNEGQILAAVGLTVQEERVYLLLLDQPGLTSAELSDMAGTSIRLTDLCLNALEGHGLAARSSDGTGYVAATPDIVIKALIDRRREELCQVERSIGRLLTRARDALARRERRDGILEFVTGEEALSARLDHLQRTAEREVLGFVTGNCPYRAPHRTFDQARVRGVRIRMIYDRAALETPWILAAAQRQIAIGGHVRIASSLPVTISIFDDRLALVPEFDGVPGAQLVGTSALLDALRMFCELTWDRSVPFGPVANGEQDVQENGDLVSLLAAGFKDQAIARTLGLSTRTLDRRLHTLMTSLDANTRFQAGWQAAHRAPKRHE